MTFRFGRTYNLTCQKNCQKVTVRSDGGLRGGKGHRLGRRIVLGRIIGSLVAIGLYETVMILATPSLLIASGQVAGGQFDNSDTSFVLASVRMGLYGKLGVLPAVLLLVVLLLIWWGPIRQRLGGRTIVSAFVVLLGVAPAQAYYDKTDYTEAYTILPNEPAFWIPDAGANKDNQAQFDSEA